MDILVLGGSGFVGGHLARRLARDGHAVRIATRYAPGARRLAIVPGARIRQFDPYDVERLTEELEGCDALVNLIGIVNEPGRDGSGFRRAHVQLVGIAIEACRRAGVPRLVQMSALQAGSEQSHSLRTRGAGDTLVRQSGLDWTIFRPSTIFGRDDRFVSRFSALLKWMPVLPLVRPQAIMAPVFVGDVVEAFARALHRRDAVGMTYELCGPERWIRREVVEYVARERGAKRWVVELPEALGWLQARAFDFLPGGLLSSDHFQSLGVPGVCGEDGLQQLAIEPWSMRDKAPEWLRASGRQTRYRRFRELARRARGSEPA